MIRLRRGLGTFTSEATFLPISSSATACVRAARSASREPWITRREGYASQHSPIAQHRRRAADRLASLPWAQHWQMATSLVSHSRTSRTVSLSSRFVLLIYPEQGFVISQQVPDDVVAAYDGCAGEASQAASCETHGVRLGARRAGDGRLCTPAPPAPG